MDRFPNADELCAQLVTKAEISPPPTDLHAVFSLWPNLKVSEEDLDKEGYLIFLAAQGAELLVRKADPPNRKRFTLAHELGHWVLSNMEDGVLYFNNTSKESRSIHHSRQTPEETWCNDFASKLLMPKIEVHKYLGDIGEDVPSRIISGHTVFQVSEDAFLTRVADITGWIILQLFHGNNLHRIGKRFIRRSENREFVNRLIDDFLSNTHDIARLSNSQIKLPGFVANWAVKRYTREIATYLVCLVPDGTDDGYTEYRQ